MYVYIYNMCVCIYIYIYVDRERERERYLALVERDGLRVLPYAHEPEAQGRLLQEVLYVCIYIYIYIYMFAFGSRLERVLVRWCGAAARKNPPRGLHRARSDTRAPRTLDETTVLSPPARWGEGTAD